MKKNFRIEFSSFMTKKERDILKLILDNYILKKELVFNIVNLDIPKLKNSEISFFERLAKKGFWIIEPEKRIYISYFSSIILNNEKVTFQLNETFLKYINDKKLINSYSLYDFLFLKHNISLEFFFKCMLKNLENDFFEFSIAELKYELSIENYNRMYDLDRFVFQIIKEDINKNTQYIIDYEKIKKLGKVEKIKFYIKNKKDIEMKTNIKMLLFLFKSYIKDKKVFISLIEKQLKIQEYSKIKKSIVTAIKYLPKFNSNFEKSLSFVIEKGCFYEEVLIKKRIYKFENNLNILKSLFKDIQFYLSEDDEIFSHNFSDKLTKKLYTLKEKNMAIVETEKSKLELYYIGEKFFMNIYLKKEIYEEVR